MNSDRIDLHQSAVFAHLEVSRGSILVNTSDSTKQCRVNILVSYILTHINTFY